MYAGVVARHGGLVALVRDPRFAIADPDGLVTLAGWFSPEDAVRMLERLPYPPIAVPAVHYLTHGVQGTSS
ncbi:MAG TPA: hypothetical protein VGL05_11865 [Kribbella sp.]